MECNPIRIIARRRVKHQAAAQCQAASCTETRETPCNARNKSRDGRGACKPDPLPSVPLPLAERDCTCGDREVDSLVQHLDDVGQALEHTFREVDSIDAYVIKLRSNFDLDVVPEHRFMVCMVKARLAREVCCRQQVEKWRELRLNMLKLYSAPTSDQADPRVTPGLGTRYPDFETSAFLVRLSKMSTLKNVIRRLDPGQDVRSFVERWILQKAH